MIQASAVKKMGVGFLASLCAIWVLGGRVAYGEEAQQTPPVAYADTAREGLMHRAAVIRTLTGVADFEYTFGASRCERRREEAQKYASDTKWAGEVLPLDPVHRSRLEFEADFARGQWRCDMTDLTVSGHNMWASSNHPALNRQLPPQTFRRISISDGVRIYDDHRSTKEGWVQYHTGKSGYLSEPLLYVQTMVIGVSPSVLEAMKDPRYDISFQGEELVADHRCLKVRVAPRDPSFSVPTTTLWCAPDLDFAVLRDETVSYAPPSAPGGERMLAARWLGTSTEFQRFSDLLWYPRTRTRSLYQYQPGVPPGTDPWEYTEIIHLTSAVANGPITGVVVPYVFPAGTSVNDRTVPANAPSIGK